MTHILIAEDETRIATFIEKGFRSNGFTTTVAKNGLEALHLVQDNPFDLLILDLGLPEKDGLEVLETLRGQGQTLPLQENAPAFRGRGLVLLTLRHG
ncbi:MAG: response regulator [Leptolyngbyaceae cyanobacterium RU_5_1]|nr:response regulator [Leptolyngbyaceae cyanobacterium RU_5_1]